MSISRNGLGIVVLAAAAFVAGRFGFPPGAPLVAAQPDSDDKKTAPATPTDFASPHHEHLGALVGTWAGEVRVWWQPDTEPMVTKGQVSRTWVLDGRFVREDWESEAPEGVTFRGIGYMGYNTADGVFETVWMDNMMSTAMVMDRGVYDAETHTLHMAGLHRDAETGKMIHTRAALDLSDPDRHVYGGWVRGMDGKEWKSFEGVMIRQ